MLAERLRRKLAALPLHTESHSVPLTASFGVSVAINNESEVIERLAEAREWHYAFSTLVKQGRRIGIWFAATANISSSRLKSLFAQFRFSSNDEALFEACLQT
jgi:hypothetical protein